MSDYKEIIVKEYHNEKGLLTRREIGEEIVRCKNCMYVHANKNNRQLTCNRRMLGAVRPNDYCSLGVYESEEEQNHE